MDWGLAGYGEHPINGQASQIESCVSHLEGVAGDIRDQISRFRAMDAGEFWQSAHGAHESFQEVAEDLPDKLELVATRYEKVRNALSDFHPALASTKEDAEYWIGKAEEAQAEVDRARSGVESMEEFEDNADDGETWTGEDYRGTLDSAEGDLQTAISNVQSAVSSFESAAETCASAIRDANNDDLKNDSGWFSWVPSWDDILDFLEVIVEILEIIALVLAVVALFVPGLNFIIFAVAAAIFLGTLVLYLNDRKDGWDLALAGIGFAAAGLGAAFQGISNLARGGTFFKAGTDTIGAVNTIQGSQAIASLVAKVEFADTMLTFAGAGWEIGTKFLDTSGGLSIDIDKGTSYFTENAFPKATEHFDMPAISAINVVSPITIPISALTQNSSAPVPAGVN